MKRRPPRSRRWAHPARRGRRKVKTTAAVRTSPWKPPALARGDDKEKARCSADRAAKAETARGGRTAHVYREMWYAYRGRRYW